MTNKKEIFEVMEELGCYITGTSFNSLISADHLFNITFELNGNYHSMPIYSKDNPKTIREKIERLSNKN